MTTEKLYAVEMTQREAGQFLYAIERVTQVWLSGKARDRHLKQRNVHSYNAIQKLMAELRRIVYCDLGSPEEPGTVFDRDLARQNEEEAQLLDGIFDPSREVDDNENI
jgi:hypothetical protein